MRRLSSIIFAALLLTPPSSLAELSDLAEVEALSAKAAALIGKGDLKGAVEAFRPHWPLPKHEIDAALYQMEQSQPRIAARFGKPLSMELAGTQRLGDSFIKHIYLQKFERHAIAWVFSFYRPDEKWLTNSVIFTDQLDGLFEWDLQPPPGASSEEGAA